MIEYLIAAACGAIAAVAYPPANANWRSIVKECMPMLDRQFNDRDGVPHTFFGVVHGEDDYYYGMWNRQTRSLVLLSCVGSIEGHGFKPVLTNSNG